MATNYANRILQMLTEQQSTYPSRATIFRIDGSYLDVRFGSSPSVVRNVEVVGDPLMLDVGDEVLVYWQNMPGRHGKTPVVYVSDRDIMTNTEGGLPAVDGITIDYGVSGLHVPRGGIALENLSFLPSLDGHSHRTPLEQFGWNFTNDGIMFSGETYIHPDGQIALGSGDDTIKLDSAHATYRLWAGAQDPTAAPFSVTKAGAILASSGVIAGWNIYETYLDNNDVRLDPDGEITVGEYGTNDVAVLSSQDVNDWRLWIGHADPASAPFRVDKTGSVWLDNATIAGSFQSSSYNSGLYGWRIDQDGWAEFNDVVIRGVLANVVFQYDPISIISGRVRVSDSVTLIADMAAIDTTMDVDTNTAEEHDIIQFKTTSVRKEWIKITSSPLTISGGFRYDITRNLEGSGAVDFYTGESGSVTGSATEPAAPLMFGEGTFGAHYPFAGRSYSSQGGFLTLDGSREYGPYFGVARRFGASYSQIEDIARLGLLEGFLGETRDVYGIAIGDATQSLKYSYEDGLTILTRSGMTTMDADGLRTDAFGIYIQTDAPSYVDQTALFYVDEDDKGLYCVYKDGVYEYTKLISTMEGGAGWDSLVDDGSPQLGGDLDLNGFNIDFPTTPNISDVLDEDDMATDSSSMLATQQSIKRYIDNYMDGTSIADGIQLNTAVQQTAAEGKLTWNVDDGTLQVGMPGGDVNLQIGQEQLLRATNQSGGNFTNGQVVYIEGAQGSRPTIDLAQADNHITAGNTIGILTEDIDNGDSGYVTTYGLVRDIDTSAFSAGDVVWLSATVAGAYSGTRPNLPDYRIRLGYVLFSNVSSGVILFDKENHSHVNHASSEMRSLDGLAYGKSDMTIVSDTGLKLDIELVGGGDLKFLINGVYSVLDCTTGSGVGGTARVALTAGSDANNPVTNYVYVTDSSGVATLVASTSLPTGAFAWIGKIIVPDATTWAATGAYGFQRYTEAFSNDSRGTQSHAREKLRALGAVYIAGITQTLNITPGTPDVVHLATGAGSVHQLHRQDFPAFSTGPYYYGNGVDAYEEISDLASALNLDDGTAITNNQKFNLVIWGAVNISSGECKLFVNLPNAVYSLDSQAMSDRDNTADYTVPDDMRSVAFMIARVAMSYSTSGSGDWTELGIYSLLGTPSGARSGGAGAVASNEFDDSQFNIYDSADVTKLLAFQLSGIATGTTRTLTIPDASGVIELEGHTHAWLDQDVTTAGNPTFLSLILGGASGYTLSVGSGGANAVALFESTDANAFIYLKDGDTTADDKVRLGADGDNLELWAGGINALSLTSDTLNMYGHMVVHGTSAYIDLNETDSTDPNDLWRTKMNADDLIFQYWDDSLSLMTYNLTLTNSGLMSWDGWGFKIESSGPAIYMYETDASDPADSWRMVYAGDNWKLIHYDNSASSANTAIQVTPDRAIDIWCSTFDIQQLGDGAGLRIYGYDDKSSVSLQLFEDASGNGYVQQSSGSLYLRSYSGNTILSCLSGHYIYSLLGDAAGASKHIFYASDWDAVAAISSLGDLARRGFFDAHDVGGGVTLPTTFVPVNWDTQDREDSDFYTFRGAANYDVYFAVAGDYKITYDITATCGANITRFQANAQAELYPTGGPWAVIPGTVRACYLRNAAPQSSMSCTKIVTVAAGDYMRIQAKSNHATFVTTVANGCSWTIEKIS